MLHRSSPRSTRPLTVTRRGLQIALGVFWLLAGLLQCQPYMFTGKFAADILAPAAEGQPWLVATPVHWAAQIVGTHPVPVNVSFAAVQLLLGAALLWGRQVRGVLAASILWSLGVWWLGEGLGGLAGGHTTLLTGAPGAVLLYAMLAVAAWPNRHTEGSDDEVRPRRFALAAWIAVWTLGVIYQLMPGQRSAADIAAALSNSASDVPEPLAAAGSHLADAFQHHGSYLVAVVTAQLLIAAGALLPGVARQVSIAAGCLLAAGFWAFGQCLGQLFSGNSTDPNAGPLLIVLGVAAAAIPSLPRRASPFATATFFSRVRPGGQLRARRQSGSPATHPSEAVSGEACTRRPQPASPTRLTNAAATATTQ